MKKIVQAALFLLPCCMQAIALGAQQPEASISFTVSMEEPDAQHFHVTMQYKNTGAAPLDFKMPVWTPGYYQLMDYEKNLESFSAADDSGNQLHWEKPGKNSWRINPGKASLVLLSYDVKATTTFVANAYLDRHRAYIIPGALFLYLDNQLEKPVTVQVTPYQKWPDVIATGLDTIAGKRHDFYASNYDVLYDSPLLLGELEQLPTFTVNGKPHYFTGYQPGTFNRQQFIEDLKKIVQSSVAIIGDIPYSHYSFLAIGPGRGGIEHLNSTSLSFSNGEGFETPENRKRLYSFIAHEYFHHYNVKRIRPIELGPFDYSRENRTKMLWVAEGFTVYYEYLVVKRAGLTTDKDVLDAIRTNIAAYENKPGHLFQSATQASYDTWSDGPFGRTGDELNKTISYYDKGPVLGLLLDFAIRHATSNRQSLDDVMRLLYKKYYQQKKRGFTEQEFQMECEKIAGTPLTELFEYASTVKDIDYPKYFNYAGLAIDTTLKELPATYLGISVKEKDSALIVTAVDWNSPAWSKGLKINNKILSIDGNKFSRSELSKLINSKKAGDTIALLIDTEGKQKEVPVVLGKKSEKSFNITPVNHPGALQSAIYASWLKKDDLGK